MKPIAKRTTPRSGLPRLADHTTARAVGSLPRRAHSETVGCLPVAVAMPNGRCRLHGGKSTGPKTADGLERMRQSKITHGNYSEETRRAMRLIRELAAEARRTAGEL